MPQWQLNTPDEMPKSTKLLEQRPDYQRVRTEWSNGLILIMEQTAGDTRLSCNYTMIDKGNGVYDFDYSAPNYNFVDEP